MKGKQITIRALQNEINSALQDYFGEKYIGTDYLKWANDTINEVFNRHEIKELRYWQRWIVLNAEECGVSLDTSNRIAALDVELQKDKRYKYGCGHGKLICMSVAFHDELLDMTLSEVRKFLFEKKRDEYVERLKKIREDASKECEEAANKIAELLEVVF